MNWWNYLFNILTIICTVFSIFGAYKSISHYKKSERLALFVKSDVAFNESRKIIDLFTALQKLANKYCRKRGINLERAASEIGEKIKVSINTIRENLPNEDLKEIYNSFNSQQLNAETYVESFITGTVVANGELVIDEDFYKCQQIFKDMQLFIKERHENISEKIKK